MSTTETRPGRARGVLRQLRPIYLVLGVASATGVLVVDDVLHGTGVVPRLSIVNPGPYDLYVDVTGRPGDGWIAVTTAERAQTTLAEEILDVGDVWILRFTGQGETAGEQRYTRAQLDDARWRITVPPEVTEHLRALELPTPP